MLFHYYFKAVSVSSAGCRPSASAMMVTGPGLSAATIARHLPDQALRSFALRDPRSVILPFSTPRSRPPLTVNRTKLSASGQMLPSPSNTSMVT